MTAPILLLCVGSFLLGWFSYRAWIEVTGRLAIRRWHALEAQQKLAAEAESARRRVMSYGPSKAEREARVVRAEHGATWKVNCADEFAPLEVWDAFHRMAELPRGRLLP